MEGIYTHVLGGGGTLIRVDPHCHGSVGHISSNQFPATEVASGTFRLKCFSLPNVLGFT